VERVTEPKQRGEGGGAVNKEETAKTARRETNRRNNLWREDFRRRKTGHSPNAAHGSESGGRHSAERGNEGIMTWSNRTAEKRRRPSQQVNTELDGG